MARGRRRPPGAGVLAFVYVRIHFEKESFVGDKFLCPVAVAARLDKRPVRSTKAWIKQFSVHRFCAIAESPNDAHDMVRTAMLEPDFAELHGADDGEAMTVLFPSRAEPIGCREAYMHCGFFLDPVDGVNANYRSAVAATSPEMADWIARESIAARGTRMFDTTAVISASGRNLMYFGEAGYEECRAVYHKTLMEIAGDGESMESLKSISCRLGEKKWPTSKLLESLDPSVRAVLPINPRREEVIRHMLISQAGDRTARDMSDGSESGELLTSKFVALYTPAFFQTYSPSCVGAGFTVNTDAQIELVRRASLVSG